MANIELIKQLRDETEISIGECKKALEAAGGDINKAKELLKEWGKNVAAKKCERTTGQGKIEGVCACERQDWRDDRTALRNGFCGQVRRFQEFGA